MVLTNLRSSGLKSGLGTGLKVGVFHRYSDGYMRRKHLKNTPSAEENYFRRYLDEICGPTDPIMKIYKIERNGKQVCVDCLFLERYDSKTGVFKFPNPSNVLESIRGKFGPGKYLLRTVYSNGKFGPSRVVQIG